jgi:uncharacterized membrane protein SpoIIM required for sporulation
MGPITKSEKFVQSKKGQWEKLHQILLTLNTKGFSSLAPEEISVFPRLYRLTCADLAEAKTLRLSPDVLDYLNQLVGQAHKFLYSFPPLKKKELKDFFLEKLPGIMLKNWVFLLLASFLFFGSYGTAYVIVSTNPSVAELIVPRSTLSQMEESYREAIDEERALSAKNFMVSFYIQNNISIAFASFALGVLLGVGTIYILIYNGIVLGAITGYIFALGYGKNFIHFVTGHSVAELTGLILAGAAGLALGFSIIKATRYYRREWLGLQRRNIFTLVAAAGILIFIAAMIEGLLSPSLVPYRYKAGAAILTALFIIGYFFIWPIVYSKNNKQEVSR